MSVYNIVYMCVYVRTCVCVYLGYFPDEGTLQEWGGERRENQRSRDKIT